MITHAASNQPGEPSVRDMSAETIKMPEPIIDPITIIVESYKPRPRVNSVSCAGALTFASGIMSI